MANTKSKRTSKSESAPEPGFLASAARSVGYAAGRAAKAIGLEHAPQIEPRKASKGSARARRKTDAEEVKSKAAELLSKGAADPGAPFRRVMGKPAANWTTKDIAYVSGLLAKGA